MTERIQKVLALAGVASRRKSEDLIREGRVTVDGKPAQIGQVVDAGSAKIAVDGRQVTTNSLRYLAMNKPEES